MSDPAAPEAEPASSLDLTGTAPHARQRDVLLVDLPETRVRRPRDLLGLLTSLAGIGVVLLLAVYAHATATGVTEDVQLAATTMLRQVLLLPVTVLEGLVTFFLPLLIIVLQLVRGRWRNVAESIAAAAVAGALTAGAALLLDTYGPSALATGLTITSAGATVIAMNHYAAALAALLTALSRRSQSATVRWSWTLLWIVLGLSVIRGDLTLPGALVTVLLGRVAGLGMRYATGVLNERAGGISLVQGLRRAGVDATRVVRLDPPRGGPAPQAWTVTTSAPLGYTERLREALTSRAPSVTTPPDDGDDPVTPAAPSDEPTGEGPSARPAAPDDRPAPSGSHRIDAPHHLALPGIGQPHPLDTIQPEALTDPEAVVTAASSGSVTLDPVGAHRVYSVWDTAGTRWYLVTLDGDRQVVGYLASVWAQLRRRGLNRRRPTSLRATADHATLLSYAAQQAGVRTPPLVGIAEAQDSVLLVSQHISHARRLSDIPAEHVTDDLVDQTWQQLRTAHAHGVAHQALAASAVLVDPDERVWLLDWENGDIASSELSRRIDLAQLLALSASKVGEERALAAAARNLGGEQLASIAPLLQPVVLPSETRSAAGNARELLNSLRSRLVDQVPAADVEPVRLARFSVRTVVMVGIAVVAVWLVLGSLNFEQVVAATRTANPLWLVASFTLAMFTFVGSAMGLVAFSPERLGLWRTIIVQVAASIINLVAPAGVGPAAINLRFLAKRRVATPLAVATVALVQVSQFVTTVLLLVVLVLITGSAGTLSLPSGAVNAVGVTLLVLISVVLLVAPLRSWVWAKIGPMLRQVWPRVLWVVGNPGRLLLGISGNIIMTVGYVASFGAALAAFGHVLAPSTLAITYLTSNTVGAAVPAPGGIGPVEAALTGGLTVAGLPAGVAFSTALVFRLLTFWARVPLGWFALRWLQRHNEV